MLLVIVLCGVASAKPKTYRYRSYYSMLYAGPRTERVAMFTLVRDGDKATLTVEKSSRGVAAEWKVEPVVVYEGSAADTTNGGLRLELATEDGKQIVDTCKASTLRVGGATAVLVPSKDNSECNSILEWSPRKTTKVPVLECTVEARDSDDDPVIPRIVTFGPEPGIEAIAINDDCAMQGSGFRKIKSPATIAPSRGKAWR